MSQAMWMLDEYDTLLACNLAVEKLTRSDRAELFGRSVLDLFAPASQQILRRQLVELRRGEALRSELLLVTREDKEVWVRQEATPMFDGSGLFIGCLCTLHPLGAHLAQQGELTPREREICDRLVRGMRRAEIARQLSIAENTVHNHVKSIYRKLGVRSQTELMGLRRLDC